MWLLSRTQAAERAPLQGLSRREHGLSLSRPPTLLGFVAFWSSCPLEHRLDSGVASEGARGSSPSPGQPFFESLLNPTAAGHHEPVGLTSTATVSLNQLTMCPSTMPVNLAMKKEASLISTFNEEFFLLMRAPRSPSAAPT
jgi:hypothetical protein